jgi:hypothetical protein
MLLIASGSNGHSQAVSSSPGCFFADFTKKDVHTACEDTRWNSDIPPHSGDRS